MLLEKGCGIIYIKIIFIMLFFFILIIYYEEIYFIVICYYRCGCKLFCLIKGKYFCNFLKLFNR